MTACLVLTSLALEMCLEKWFQFETATADSYSHIKLQPFPQLTVCPAAPYKLETLKAHGISETRDIQFGADWISNDSNIRWRLKIFSPATSHPCILSGLTSFTRVFCTKSRSWWRKSRLIWRNRFRETLGYDCLREISAFVMRVFTLKLSITSTDAVSPFTCRSAF